MARHHNIFVSDDTIKRGVSAQRAHAKSIRLWTDDNPAFAPDTVDTHPRRQLRLSIPSVDGCSLKENTVPLTNVVLPAQRRLGMRAPDALDRQGDPKAKISVRWPARRSASSKLLTHNEARRIATNITKLLELLRG